MFFSMTQVENEEKSVKKILVSYFILATFVTASLLIFIWFEMSEDYTFEEASNFTEGTSPPDLELKKLPNFLSLATRNYKQIFVESDGFSELDLDKRIEDDVLAFQEIRIHNKFWKRPGRGSVEIFNKLGRTFYVVSAAQVKHNNEIYQHSFGLAISLNSGFKCEKHEVVFVENSKEAKGGICVKGEIHNKKIGICGVHGEWENAKGGWENKDNLKMIENIILKFEDVPFVILGDFNVRYENVKKFESDYPHVKIVYNETITFYDPVYGYSDPDHYMLGNIELFKEPKYLKFNSDHYWIENIVIYLKGT